MFIKTETTPNPANLKFLPGRPVAGPGTIDFPDVAAAQRSPLAERLFGVEGVSGVFLGPDFITVTKSATHDWQLLKPEVLGAILDHFVSGEPILHESEGATGNGSDDAAVVAQIEEIIATRVRPAAQQSGGDVVFREFRDGVVQLELSGGAAALLGPIGNMLRHFLPEVQDVRDVQDDLDKPGLATPAGQAVQRVLAERINPAVASHGGHISLVDVQDDTAYIRLEGGCQGCGMADVTLKQGVEHEILQEVSEIARVLDVTDHAGGSNPYYQPGKGDMSPY